MLKELYDNTVLWQMSPAERMAMFYLFDRMPFKRTAIEIGSYCGGFTNILATKFDVVHAIDIDFSKLACNAPNVIKHEMLSIKAIPTVMFYNVDFILVDADHEYNGVLGDVSTILSHMHSKCKPIILVHDAAYPESRRALMTIRDTFNNVTVDPDFVPGVPFGETKIGGLGLIRINP